ncbi:MAG TPA: hypothetical protein VFN44_06945, partial [Solirubrobacteraceae bacterium]|nr:hypothetical protein [Solirubrobacteraceae bacterium]
VPAALAAVVRAVVRRLPPPGLGAGDPDGLGARLGFARGGRLRPVPVAAAVGCVGIVAVLAWRHAHPPFRAGAGEVVVSSWTSGRATRR